MTLGLPRVTAEPEAMNEEWGSAVRVSTNWLPYNSSTSQSRRAVAAGQTLQGGCSTLNSMALPSRRSAKPP